METVTLNGMPMHTVGNLPAVGSEAPNFALVLPDLSEICLHDYKGKKLVLNIFPSLDTDVCAASVRRFNKEAAALDNVEIVCVSMDLPFADARFCAANNIDHVKTASAFRSSFGKEYGIELADGPMRGLLARAVVIVDEEGKIKATSLSDIITEEPDYTFVLDQLKK